jgi:hypothetical protein
MSEMLVEAGSEAAAKGAAFWRAEAKRGYVDPFNIAAMYAALGDENLALEYLRQSVRPDRLACISLPSISGYCRSATTRYTANSCAR